MHELGLAWHCCHSVAAFTTSGGKNGIQCNYISSKEMLGCLGVNLLFVDKYSCKTISQGRLLSTFQRSLEMQLASMLCAVRPVLGCYLLA